MRADLYARKSNSDAGRSVARQERAWRSDCVDEDIEPGRVFIDPDFSASRFATRDRPDYGQLLAHIRGRNCEMVALWETSRGSRRMGEWVEFLDLCRAEGVLIRVFGEDPYTYDPRRQRDREVLLKEGMAAEAEVEKMRSRTRSGTADAAAQGRPPGPKVDGYIRVYGAPTEGSVSLSGTRRRDIQQVIDEPRAQIYRWAAEGILNGVPANTIARILNAWEVPTPTGQSTWAGNALVSRLLRPSMEGHRELGGVIVARNAWPAILKPEVAAALRQTVRVPDRRIGRADTRLRHQMSGALLCGRCRQGMQGHLRTVRRKSVVRYECEPRRNGCGKLSGLAPPIDEIVSQMVIRRLQDPDALRLFEPVRDDGPVRAAQDALDALTARRDELYSEAARPGGPSMALVAAAERELLPQIEAATVRLRALQVPPVLRGYDPQRLADRWWSYSVGDRRAVVAGLAEVVLSPVGRGGTWSMLRLGESRWRGAESTWGDAWRAASASVSVAEDVEAHFEVAE